MALDLATKKAKPILNPPDYKVGVRFGWLYGDLQGLKKLIISKEISRADIGTLVSQIFLTFIRSRSHPTWSLKDPLPTLVIYSKLFMSAFKKAFKLT